jgi:hypothetical protein
LEGHPSTASQLNSRRPSTSSLDNEGTRSLQGGSHPADASKASSRRSSLGSGDTERREKHESIFSSVIPSMEGNVPKQFYSELPGYQLDDDDLDAFFAAEFDRLT